MKAPGEGGRDGSLGEEPASGAERAPEEEPRKRRGMRLWSKLALAMIVAALLPLAMSSVMAIRVMLGGLEHSLKDQGHQTADIAMNLLLRQVQRIAVEGRSLAASPQLRLLESPDKVSAFLDGYGGVAGWSQIEVADEKGKLVARRRPDDSFDGLQLKADMLSLRKALDYEHYVTITRIGTVLAIRAAAPIVDEQFVVRGAVVITSPLDQHMADYIKGVLRAEIGFVVGDKPVASTFFANDGTRVAGVEPSAAVVEAVSRRDAADAIERVGEHEYSLVFVPLQTVDGDPIGMMSVALDRGELVRAQSSAVRSVAAGAALALTLAIGLGVLLGRRITTPLRRLQARAGAIASGDLGRGLAVEADDEIGELAKAFLKMTDALQEHQERLNARIRELSTLHEITRAVSSVLSLDEVLRLVITETAEVLQAGRVALLLARGDETLELRDQVGLGEELPTRWGDIAQEVVARHAPSADDRLIGVPLETREHVVGALVIGRPDSAAAFGPADVRLLVTFAGQAATAIDNARLYAEVTAFSEALEEQVQVRTAELRTTNEELGHAIEELRNTQAQLLHSERMAGIGSLVAGIAHEINSPAGAIQGMAQVLGATMQRLASRLCELIDSAELPRGEPSGIMRAWMETRRIQSEAGVAPEIVSPAEVRRRTRDLHSKIEQRNIPEARRLARRLVEAQAESLLDQVIELASRVSPDLVVGVVEDLSFIDRNARSIQTATSSVVRIVRALRNYAHADGESVSVVDVTEGLETTLTILHNELRYGINVVRKYAPLPNVAAYVDDLNQVWTNLIHNAVQAMGGKGELVIETFVIDDEDEVGVRITDDGPGVPAEVLPRIFEPFFSTKQRGEGMGLGLGIARKIVEKHGGQIAVESHPGKTTFTVILPVKGPVTTTDDAAA